MTQHRRGGGQPGNRNRTRHGLRGSALPSGCSYLASSLQSLRTSIRDELERAHGQVTLTDEAALQSLIRHESRALLASRWLRLEGENLKLADRLALLQTISQASDARDRALDRLGLDRDSTTSIIDALYRQPALRDDSASERNEACEASQSSGEQTAAESTLDALNDRTLPDGGQEGAGAE